MRGKQGGARDILSKRWWRRGRPRPCGRQWRSRLRLSVVLTKTSQSQKAHGRGRPRLHLNLGGSKAGRSMHGAFALYLLQQRRIDIATAEDRDVAGGLRQFLTVKEKGRYSHGAARFGSKFGIDGEPPHCFANFLFAHGDNVIDKALNVGKSDIAQTLRAQAVSEGAGHLLRGPVDDVPSTQASLRVGGKLRLHANDFYRMLRGQLECRRNP